jgi:hypothetical protein
MGQSPQSGTLGTNGTTGTNGTLGTANAIADLLRRTAAIRPKGYTDEQWLAAIADAKRLGYGSNL